MVASGTISARTPVSGNGASFALSFRAVANGTSNAFPTHKRHYKVFDAL